MNIYTSICTKIRYLFHIYISIVKDSDRLSRELLVNMCSFGASHAPLASAECLKSAPKTIDHGNDLYALMFINNFVCIYVLLCFML